MPFHVNNLIGFGAASGAAFAGPSFVVAGTGATNTGSNTLSVDYPAGIAANDIIICHAIGEEDTGTVAGDTSISSVSNFVSVVAGFGATGKYGQAIWYKRATGSESGSETVTLSALDVTNRSISAIMYLFRSCITSGAPTENTASTDNAASSTWNQKSIAGTDINRLLIHCIGSPTSTTTASFTGETNGDFIERATYASGNATLQLQTCETPTAVTVSGGSFTAGASARYNQIVAALKPN